MDRLDYLVPLMCTNGGGACLWGVLCHFGVDTGYKSDREWRDLDVVLEGASLEDVAVRVNSAVARCLHRGNWAFREEFLGDVILSSVVNLNDKDAVNINSGISGDVYSGIVGFTGGTITRLSVSCYKYEGLPNVGCVSEIALNTWKYGFWGDDNDPIGVLDVDIEKLRENLMQYAGVSDLHIVFRHGDNLTFYSRTGCLPAEGAGYSFDCAGVRVVGYDAGDSVDFVKGAKDNMFLPMPTIMGARDACDGIARNFDDRRKCVYSTSGLKGNRRVGVCMGDRDKEWEMVWPNGWGHGKPQRVEYWDIVDLKGMRAAEASIFNARIRTLFGRQRLFVADVVDMYGIDLGDAGWFIPGLGVYTVVPVDGDLGYFIVNGGFETSLNSQQHFKASCDGGSLAVWLSKYGLSVDFSGDKSNLDFVKFTDARLASILG